MKNTRFVRVAPLLAFATSFACSSSDDGVGPGSQQENETDPTVGSGGNVGELPNGTGGEGSEVPGGTGGVGSEVPSGTGGAGVTCEMTLCGTACVDTASDPNYCGSCDNPCESNETCEAGICTPSSCAAGEELCQGECVDTATNPLHCGGCMAPCGSGQTCVSGTCEGLEVPPASYCDPTRTWDSGWTDFEFEVLELVNRRRAAGANCGGEGFFGPAEPLVMDASLVCAARMHSKDMGDRDFYDHRNPDGQGVGDRATAAGFEWRSAGENIFQSPRNAQDAVDGWMESDGHCANIMNPRFTHTGVGYYYEPTEPRFPDFWTQVFGLPR